MSTSALNSIEKKASLSLAAVFGMRMIGLFMILPVFAIYGVELEGYSPLWLGLAIGAYGFTQALLQIPMGILSDKFGRKPVILGGLVLFCIGSIVAAQSESVYGVVFGRALQGMGAIASATLALAADLSREEQRPKVMATIGMFIGLSFAIAMVLGPVVAKDYGLAGLFYLTAIFAVFGMALVLFVVPNAVTTAPKGDLVAAPTALLSMLKDSQLMRLNLGVFILHMALTAMFVVLPVQLTEVGFAISDHWRLYLPALLVSFALMVPVMIIAIKKNKEKLAFCGAILLMTATLLTLWQASTDFTLIVILVVLFFVAFNYLEATMPANLSRIAPAGQKGSAMGIFSSSQFFGAFCGGALGGVITQLWGNSQVFLVSALLMIVWFLLALGMKPIVKSKSLSFNINLTDESHAQQLANRLANMPGVIESSIVFTDSVAYVKVDDKVIDMEQLKTVLN
ncbi:MFS transporter [Thalassotalea sp. HSM 43]|uniref:MFS transporter n=1 Tax=Thalassotalea sp. HSM 43 TaxID=2552945 RepID=UPI0010822D91|nr:MFS transporter [Thalassotalea sp. HSM 43]QBY04725.1 MFS transporter [Thalassotalea sp. HSM 43]